MAIKKEKKAVTKKGAAKKESKVSKSKKKTEELKEINGLVETARELAENQIASIEVTPEPEIIMTTPDAFNSINDVKDITDNISVDTNVASNGNEISDQQRALNVIANMNNMKEKIQYNIHQREVAKEPVKETPVEQVVEKKVEVTAPELSQEQIEENIFSNFIAMRPGAIEINHFELAYAGINVARFEQFEGRIGKYKLNRVYIGGPWTFTISK